MISFCARCGRSFACDRGEEAPEGIEVACTTESDVRLQLSQVLEGTGELVLVEVSPIDIDRMRSVWQAAAQAGRKVVLPSKQAYMVSQASLRTSIADLPPVSDTVLYLPQRKKNKRDIAPGEPEDSEEFTKGRDRWEQSLVAEWQRQGGAVCWGTEGRAELAANGWHYMICAPDVASVLPELCYRARTCSVTFVLSKSEPFNEEMVISFDKLLHWLALYGCGSYYQMHVSGHATPADLCRIIDAANPDVLIPIHTRFPEMFVGWHDHVIADIAQGVPYVL